MADTIAPFRESQKLNLFWVFFTFAIVALLVCRVLLVDVEQISAAEWTALGTSTLLALQFTFLRLDIMIDHKGIKYRWRPFRYTYSVITWDRIETVHIRSFNALTEFGGWGMRYNLHATAYIVRGDQGIELKYKDKKRFFFLSTQRAAEAQQAIHAHFQSPS